MRIRLLVIVAVLGLSADAARATPPDPCGLLTEAEVTSALGVQVGPGSPIGTKVCQWTQTGAPGPEGPKKVMLAFMTQQGFCDADDADQ